MAPLETIRLPWAQGVGRSNRPAPTILLPIPKELFDRRSIGFSIPLPLLCQTLDAFVGLPSVTRQSDNGSSRDQTGMQNICELPFHRRSRKRAPIARPICASLLLAVISCPAQTLSVVKDASVYNRPVLLVGNEKLEIAIVKQGGSMLRIQLQGDPQGISPFGNPELVPGVPDNRKLNGPMVGHFVCVDGFGPPSKEEAAAGLAMHCEAYLQPWKLVSAEKQAGVATVKFTVDLPKFEETFARSLQMVDGENVIYIDSELTSGTAFDRTANWGEHPFLYPFFVERGNTVVDVSGARSRTRTYPPNSRPGTLLQQSQDFNWPGAPGAGGSAFDMRETPEGVN